MINFASSSTLSAETWPRLWTTCPTHTDDITHDTMDESEKKIARKTINWCKSVKKNIGKFSYEYEDEDCYGDYNDEDYPLESDFEEVITRQLERLNDVHVELDDFLEHYDCDHGYEFRQASMSIASAEAELQDILSNISSWDNSSDFNNEIVTAVEHLDEAIEYLASER